MRSLCGQRRSHGGSSCLYVLKCTKSGHEFQFFMDIYKRIGHWRLKDLPSQISVVHEGVGCVFDFIAE